MIVSNISSSDLHEQSSPHQQPVLMGGFAIVDAVEETDPGIAINLRWFRLENYKAEDAGKLVVQRLLIYWAALVYYFIPIMCIFLCNLHITSAIQMQCKRENGRRN